MTMPQIGKQYRVNIRPNPEYSCRHCGHVIGADRKAGEWPQGEIVTVLRQAVSPKCPRCHQDYPSEGHFQINELNVWGFPYALPYTWLVPLEVQE